MKKIICLFLIILYSLGVSAQTETSHLSFKGIPMDCAVKEYARKLEDKGFNVLQRGKSAAILEGIFAGHDESLVHIFSNGKKAEVSEVSVHLPFCINKADLVPEYNSVYGMLTGIYGQPSGTSPCPDSIDSIQTVYRIYKGDLKIYALFRTSAGNIRLSMESNGSMGYICVTYTDRMNAGLDL